MRHQVYLGNMVLNESNYSQQVLDSQVSDIKPQKNKNEYKQINSSTGLAVNYYKILEDNGNIEELKKVLIKEMEKAGVDVRLKTEVKDIKTDGNSFRVCTPWESIVCDKIIVATGDVHELISEDSEFKKIYLSVY